MAAVTVKALRDLRGKLAGRGENKDSRGSAAGSLRVVVKGVENGQGECRSFSCASLSDAEKVPSFKKDRDGLRLNR